MPELQFSRLLIAELPFTMNLPDGEYRVQVNSTVFPLRLRQEHGALSLDEGRHQLIPMTAVTPANSARVTHLRTLVELRATRSVAASEVKQADTSELIQSLARRLISERRTLLSGQELLAQAEAELLALNTSGREALTEHVSRALHSRTLFPTPTHDDFVRAANELVRHYMVEFEDQFAEEVSLHHLASSWTSGVIQVLECNDVILDSVHYAGKIPPILKRPWLKHPPERIDQFRSRLDSGMPPDPVDLLLVRARSFLERGATRSAIIEASAALESSVSRRIRAAFIANGLSVEDASKRLSDTQRFSERCKSLMKNATGTSLAAANPALWERVVKHRDNFRHKVTHDETEPSEKDAEDVIEDFAALIRIVKSI